MRNYVIHCWKFVPTDYKSKNPFEVITDPKLVKECKRQFHKEEWNYDAERRPMLIKERVK